MMTSSLYLYQYDRLLISWHEYGLDVAVMACIVYFSNSVDGVADVARDTLNCMKRLHWST